MKNLSLKSRILRAGSWTLAGHGVGQIIRLGSNLVMTRLLVPEMFGVMSVAITLNMVLHMLSDLGLRQNIVQSRRGEDPIFLDSAWVIQIIRGVLLWIVALLVSIGIYIGNTYGFAPQNSVYASPSLPLVLAVTSLSAVVNGFQSTNIATAHRSFDQKRLAQIALISQLSGLIFMIAIGSLTHSIWALVAGGLIGAITTTVLSHTWLDGHKNRFRYEKAAISELFGFGKWVFISSVLYVLAINGDKLILGAFVDAEILGLYVIASLFISAIAGVLNKLFFTVSLPALSEIARNTPEKLHRIYNKMCIPADLALLFLTGLLFSAGYLIVDLLYDHRYSAAGEILQILALTLFAVRYEVARQVYMALGVPHHGTIMSVVRFTSLCIAVPLAYNLGGMQGAIWGIALHPIAAIPVVYIANAKLGLNDIRREIMVLPALPVGILCGWVLKTLFS